MKQTSYLLLAAVMFIVGLCSLACGDDSTSSSSSSSSFSCCVNGRYYSCESSEAVNQCVMSNFDGCDRDSSKDDSECSN